MRRWLVLGLAGCNWVTDDDFRSRLDRDADGVPAASDCNDGDPDVAELTPTDEAELSCGDTVTAEVSGPNLLAVANCPHPLSPDQLTHYAHSEDIRWFRPDADARVTLTLDAAPGFTQLEPDRPQADPEADLRGVALFAWRGATCAPEHCELGLPIASEEQQESGGWESRLTLTAESSEVWAIIVTGDLGSPYELTIDCDL